MIKKIRKRKAEKRIERLCAAFNAAKENILEDVLDINSDFNLGIVASESTQAIIAEEYYAHPIVDAVKSLRKHGYVTPTIVDDFNRLMTNKIVTSGKFEQSLQDVYHSRYIATIPHILDSEEFKKVQNSSPS